jgi:3',5'-cyclic AMP phosphodiesterase CpdA
MLIAQLSDLHVMPHGALAYGVVDTNPFVERAFKTVSELDPRPDVVILSGDLTDGGLDAEYDILAALIRRHLHMPVYVIPGNHDRREGMKARLGHLPGVSADPEFIHYVVDDHPVRLVMLDSIVAQQSHGELCAARLAFLERALSEAPKKPTLVVLHHPPFLTGIAHMDEVSLRRPEAFEAVIRRHPQVERILCGHAHRPIIARFGGTLVQVAPSVAHQVVLDLRPDGPATFNLEPPAFLLHHWRPEARLVSHQAYVGEFAGPYPFDMEDETAVSMLR